MNNIKVNITGNVSNLTITDSIQTDEYNQISSSTIKSRNNLLNDIVDKAIRMTERKHTKKIEDLHNDDLTDWLRDKGYYVTDQTRSGKSLLNAGEIDIMIRENNGTPLSIIEAFRLSSCGEKNTTVVEHLNKLLNKYDMIGNEENYAIIYSEAYDFSNLWRNYFEYVSKINEQEAFDSKSELVSFEDVSSTYSNKTGLRVGYASHKKNDKTINVYHIFIDMHI